MKQSPKVIEKLKANIYLVCQPQILLFPFIKKYIEATNNIFR